MQAIEICADISPEGHICLPLPLRNLYGSQARLILLVDELSISGETLASDESDELQKYDSVTQEMEKIWHSWPSLGYDPEPLLRGKDQERMLQKIIETLPEVVAVYACKEQLDPHSELELAILLEENADVVALWSLAKTLSEAADFSVNLFDLRTASSKTQYQVVTSGERWWFATPQAGLFECFVLSENDVLGTC
ncbi:MAG: hypothetical protein HQL93_01025 [Magnetococcales bacterium]|nr:hypothetical protein [Magnetococcales bacterium]